MTLEDLLSMPEDKRIEEIENNTESRSIVGEIIKSLSDDEKKVKLIEEYAYLMIGGRYEGIIGDAISTIKDDDRIVEILEKNLKNRLGMNGDEVCTAIEAIGDDNKKVKMIDRCDYTLGSKMGDAMASIQDDEKKMNCLDRKYAEGRYLSCGSISTVIESVKDDDKKLKALEEYADNKLDTNDTCFRIYNKEELLEYKRMLRSRSIGGIIESLKSDSNKLKALNTYAHMLKERDSSRVINSIEDEDVRNNSRIEMRLRGQVSLKKLRGKAGTLRKEVRAIETLDGRVVPLDDKFVSGDKRSE